MAGKIVYREPDDYIPKSIRKELGLGEFSPEYIAQQKAKKEGKKEASKEEADRYIRGK